MSKSKKSNNYHDYVIKDGKFIGAFDQMYQDCDNPWPEDEKDLEENPVSSYLPKLIQKFGFKKVFSVGLGKGLHANWLQKNIPGLSIEGCEISKVAVEHCKKNYPKIKVHCIDIKGFCSQTWDFDLIIFREILWYILPDWDRLILDLKNRYKGRHIVLEITCYDKQSYGKEYFDGPEDIIRKFPFKIKEILRHHTSSLQREGMILILGKI